MLRIVFPRQTPKFKIRAFIYFSGWYSGFFRLIFSVHHWFLPELTGALASRIPYNSIRIHDTIEFYANQIFLGPKMVFENINLGCSVEFLPRKYVSGETHRYLGRQYRLRDIKDDVVMNDAPIKVVRGDRGIITMVVSSNPQNTSKRCWKTNSAKGTRPSSLNRSKNGSPALSVSKLSNPR